MVDGAFFCDHHKENVTKLELYRIDITFTIYEQP